MTTGDPWCPLHGMNPCRCREFPQTISGAALTTWPMAPKLPHEMRCSYCGLLHTGTCPRIKAIEYHDNGLIKRVEFHDGEALNPKGGV